MPRKNRGDLPRHLLVFRTSAMGDVAMLAHAVRALKEAYPSLRVTIATQALFQPFFAGLDVEFLTADVKGAHHSLRGMWRLAAEARRLGVDAVADVHGTLRSKTFGLSMRLRGAFASPGSARVAAKSGRLSAAAAAAWSPCGIPCCVTATSSGSSDLNLRIPGRRSLFRVPTPSDRRRGGGSASRPSRRSRARPIPRRRRVRP